MPRREMMAFLDNWVGTEEEKHLKRRTNEM